jgi:hypothetical protein
MTQEDVEREKFIRSFSLACGCGRVLYRDSYRNYSARDGENMLCINIKCDGCKMIHTIISVQDESKREK